MAALMEAVEPEVKQGLRTATAREVNASNVAKNVARGHSLWKSIYEPHADKLRNKLGSYHPDFPLFILQAYGSVLSPGSPGLQGNLNRVETSLVGIATLRAMGGVGPQLVSHVYGLLKAQKSDCYTEADQWLSSEEGALWALTTVDSICDVTRQNAEPAKL